MSVLTYTWGANKLDLVYVPGTNGKAFLYGRGPNQRSIEVAPFYIATTPVTQALWLYVMGSNPAARQDLRCPVENVSWEHVTEAGGFLDRLNGSEILKAVNASDMRFRLPSETEWEYAARGGPHWKDGFIYSGSNDPDEVAWYGPRWTRKQDFISLLLGPHRGWRFIGRTHFLKKPTRTHDVATKSPNQLGIYDMSGNVWEWCQDICTDDLNAVPSDGSPYLGAGDERRLRGGCHHNWNLHCTVSWRYGITPDAHDGCIGLRVVLAAR